MTRIDTDHSAIKILSVLSVAKRKFRAGGIPVVIFALPSNVKAEADVIFGENRLPMLCAEYCTRLLEKVAYLTVLP